MRVWGCIWATKGDRRSGALYARFGDTKFRKSQVLARVACCRIWLSIRTLEAGKWGEELGLRDASKLFLFLPPLMLLPDKTACSQCFMVLCVVYTLKIRKVLYRRDAGGIRILDNSRLFTWQKRFVFGNSNRRLWFKSPTHNLLRHQSSTRTWIRCMILEFSANILIPERESVITILEHFASGLPKPILLIEQYKFWLLRIVRAPTTAVHYTTRHCLWLLLRHLDLINWSVCSRYSTGWVFFDNFVHQLTFR